MMLQFAQIMDGGSRFKIERCLGVSKQCNTLLRPVLHLLRFLSARKRQPHWANLPYQSVGLFGKMRRNILRNGRECTEESEPVTAAWINPIYRREQRQGDDIFALVNKAFQLN